MSTILGEITLSLLQCNMGMKMLFPAECQSVDFCDRNKRPVIKYASRTHLHLSTAHDLSLSLHIDVKPKPIVNPFRHSFVNSFMRLFIHFIIYSFVSSFIHSFYNSFLPSHLPSFVHLYSTRYTQRQNRLYLASCIYIYLRKAITSQW